MALPERKDPQDAIVDLLLEELRAILRGLPPHLTEAPPKDPNPDTDIAEGEGETPQKGK